MMHLIWEQTIKYILQQIKKASCEIQYDKIAFFCKNKEEELLLLFLEIILAWIWCFEPLFIQLYLNWNWYLDTVVRDRSGNWQANEYKNRRVYPQKHWTWTENVLYRSIIYYINTYTQTSRLNYINIQPSLAITFVECSLWETNIHMNQFSNWNHM